MPNIKSAEKRVKVIAAKTLKNKMAKSELKTMIKKFDTSAATGKDEAQQAFTGAVKTVDKAVARGILHKNTAARRKSAMAKKLNAMQ